MQRDDYGKAGKGECERIVLLDIFSPVMFHFFFSTTPATYFLSSKYV